MGCVMITITHLCTGHIKPLCSVSGGLKQLPQEDQCLQHLPELRYAHAVVSLFGFSLEIVPGPLLDQTHSF